MSTLKKDSFNEFFNIFTLIKVVFLVSNCIMNNHREKIGERHNIGKLVSNIFYYKLLFFSLKDLKELRLGMRMFCKGNTGKPVRQLLQVLIAKSLFLLHVVQLIIIALQKRIGNVVL